MSNKKLTPPLLKLRSVTPQSWTNDRLPEYLWIALLIYGMGREKGIANLKLLIRDLLNVGLSTGACSFTSISKLALGEQETFVSVLLEDPERARCLAPIGILENFPGADVWKRHLHAISDIEQAWNDMAFAVGHVLFHQSQEATDVRWFVSAYHIASGRCILPTREMAEEFFKYPNHGDQRSVRPSIRAFEMMIPVDSDAKPLDNSTTEWARSFWTQMSDKTNCLIPNRGIPREPVKHFKLSSKKLWRSLSELQDSYISGRLTTAVDAKSDSIYGMTLFALQLGLEILDEPSRLSSVIVLRTITEIIINLKFLLESKESDIWTRYREYGVGQAKLVTLKMRELSEVPEYIPAEELEKIANEDRWEEFNQINVGDWTSANLRTRSEIVGLKDLYDKYFVWPSSITHAHWGAVRYASFTTCMNPVHRAHRVPEVNYHLKTVKYDLEILLLQVQGLFNSAFPDRSIDVFAELEAESPDL